MLDPLSKACIPVSEYVLISKSMGEPEGSSLGVTHRCITNNTEAVMFIAVEHDIHDPQGFKSCFEAAFPLPEDIRLHQFLPKAELSRTICVLEAPSINRLRTWHDDDLRLSDASTQYYFQVAEEEAVGLPQDQVVHTS